MSRNKHSENQRSDEASFKNEEVNLSQEEFKRIEKAFKNDEFKKLFFDYCQEIQDPENRKIYEKEIIQLEKERGVNVTFINPKPGFVLRSSVGGDTKCFINIAQCEKIAKPSNEVKNGSLMWSLPYSQSPPRHDYDDKKKCIVYDVVFHPDAIHLAERNEAIRKHVIQVALDAIEREFKVQLDRTNVKSSNLKFKGNAHPTVIRTLDRNGSGFDGESSPIDSMYPPLPTESKENVKHVTTNHHVTSEFQCPKYVIKHRHGVDFTEMTYQLDAKLNVTVPKELCVEIELPLLKSTAQCTLDVTEKRLFLSSVKPAKYRLDIELPYPVDDNRGNAKFDVELRKLKVILPVKTLGKAKNLKDLYKEDSGVESDVKDDTLSSSLNSEDHKDLIEVLSSIGNDNDDPIDSETSSKKGDEPFLQPNIHYHFPHNFDCNSLDDELAFVLHVKNVDPDSIKTEQTDKSVHLKFTSIGSGYYPTNYAFYFELENTLTPEVQITATNVEAWDNNVILNATLLNPNSFKGYLAGLDPHHTNFFNLLTKFDLPSKTQVDEHLMEVSRSESDESLENNVTTTADNNEISNEQTTSISVKKETKKQKNKNKKRRSLSESNSDDLKAIMEEAPVETPKVHIAIPRKQRSFSECRDDGSVLSYKSILKPRSSYDRSYSTSSSVSDEGQSFSCSMDLLHGGDSFGDIPEEENVGLSESCKKTVRFNDVIQKQLFRMDSSILGQRKKNQKRKIKKQRAMQRRNSEGDSADYEDNKLPIHQPLSKKERKLSNNDSGFDLNASGKARRDSESSEMFDLEI